MKTAVDNGYENLEQDDWVLLDDFDGNVAKVKEVWDVKSDLWIIVQLADGQYERVDPYSVTKTSGDIAKHWGDQSVEYQGGEWWIVGQSVKRGKTWVHLKNDNYEDNLMLEHTYRILSGHDPVLTHPFYMPVKPHYAMDNRVWFLNDLYQEKGEMIGDFVNVENVMDHMQVLFEDAKTKKIHDVDVQKMVNEYHTVNTCRRRLPAQGMKRSIKDQKALLTYQQLVAQHTNIYDPGTNAWDFSVAQFVDMPIQTFYDKFQTPFEDIMIYLCMSSNTQCCANYDGLVKDVEWISLRDR